MGIIADVLKGRLQSCACGILDLLKIKVAIALLGVVRGVRRALIAVIVMVFCAAIVACGFVLVPIALLLFMPWEPQTKAIVGIAIGAAYILIPLAVISALLSEKRWLRTLRVAELLRSVKDLK